MSKIIKVDTNGVKPLLDMRELGYDNYPAGGDVGRVYVGTGSENIALAKKVEVTAVDIKSDTHIGSLDNPHSVTKAQVGLGNVDNTSDVNKPVSTATQTALNLKANLVSPTFTGTPEAPTASVGTSSTQIATTAFVNAEIANDTYSKSQIDTALDLKVDDTEIASVNLLRADKYLAAQSVANMVYNLEGKLTKVQYNNATDVDYEVLTYDGNGKLSNVAHYTTSVLRGNTVLSYSAGKLVSAIYIGV